MDYCIAYLVSANSFLFLMKAPFLLLLLTLLLTSCQQKLYFPSRASTPMLSQALEGKLVIAAKPQMNYSDSAHGNGGLASMGIDAAFAPINHLGLFGSYRITNNRRIVENISPFIAETYGGVFSGNRWELAAGYFDKFGKKGRLEAYGGYGQGSLSRRGYITPERDFDTHYHRYFVQTAVGMGNDIFCFGGGLRFAAQQFYDFQSPNSSALRYEILDGNTDLQSVTFCFTEPFVNVEVGWKIIRFTGQVGTSLQMNGSRIAGNTPFYLSLGACFYFSPNYFKPGGLSRKVQVRKLPR